jgi:hypothetical protein
LYVYANPINLTDPSGQTPAIVAALLPSLIGAGAGFAVGAIAGGIFGYCTYEWALAGECGCDMQQQALSMTKWEWTGAHALGAGIIGGVGGAIAAAAPIGLIAVGVTGIVISGADIYNTYNIIRNETGFTACTVSRLILDVVGMVFSGAAIAKGVQQWRASGSWLRWKAPIIYATDFRRLYGATAEEIRRMVPPDYEVIHKPYPASDGTKIEQWIFRSRNGIEEVRIHQPMNDPGGPWQVRWGVKDVGQIPPDYRWMLAPPNKFDPNYWLYFDRNGVPRHYRSNAVHELFTVMVTLADMLKVFPD